MTYKIYFFILFLFCSSISFAQSTSTQKSVEELFDKPSKVQWVKHYSGRMDDFNDVEITLGYDGKHCKGKMRYVRSNEQFGLAGYLKNDKLRLREINNDEEVSGFLEGEIKGNKIYFDWANHDNSIGSTIVVSETKKESSIPSHCGNNKWIKSFSGQLNGQSVYLLMQLESNNQIKGLAYFDYHKKTFDVNGVINSSDVLKLEIINEDGNHEGVLIGDLEKNEIGHTVFTGKNGKVFKCTLFKEEDLNVGCREYADYISNYDIVFPKTKNFAFNNWIKNLTEEWLETCRKTAKKKELLNEVYDIHIRSSVRSYGWYDIDFLNENFISGIMYSSSSQQKEEALIPFNFNLKTGQEIKLADIFIANFDHQKFVWDYVNKDLQKTAIYQDYEYRKWLATTNFETFTVRKEGICFKTQRSAIYGQQSVTIPFELLKSKMKKRNQILALLN